MAYPIFPCSRYSYSSRDSHHRLRARSHFRAGLLHEADGLPRWEALRRAALTIAPPEAADSDGVGQDSEHEAAKPDAPSSPPPNDGPPTQAALGGMSAQGGLLERPHEWPSREPIVSYHDFAYQAQSWHLPRRVVAKVDWHQGELFPRVGFIVTNLSYPPKGIVRFYNGRGTAEQWIKEGKYALNWTRLSCHKFVANQVRLWLFVLTYNLGNFMRRLVLPKDMKHWTLTSLQTRLIKTGGRLVRHARRLVFQLAEVLVTREMLTGILERISRLRLAPG